MVTTEAGQRVENIALRGSEMRAASSREAALEILSTITVAVFALATAVVFILGLVLRRGGLGSLVAATMVLSVIAAELLKWSLPRPELLPGPAWLLRNSFPSGTATVATAMAVGLLVIAPNRLRWIVLPCVAGYAAVVGYAVQATGWHRLSDTVGASALAIAVAALALALLARVGLVQPSETGRIDDRIMRGLVLVAALAVLVAGTVIVLPMAFPLLATPDGSRRAFLQTAFPVLGSGLTVLFLTVFAWLVEPFSLGRSDTAERRGGPTRRVTTTPQRVGERQPERPDSTDRPAPALSDLTRHR